MENAHLLQDVLGESMTTNLWIYGDSFADRINTPTGDMFTYQTYHDMLEKKYTLQLMAESGSSPEWTEHQLHKNYPTSKKNNHYALIMLSDMHRQWMPDLRRANNDYNHTAHGLGEYKNLRDRKDIQSIMYQHSRPKIFVERWRRCLTSLRYSLELASFKRVLIVFCFAGDYVRSKPYHRLLHLPNVTVENRFVMWNLHVNDKPSKFFDAKPDPRPNHMNSYNHSIFAKYVEHELIEQTPYNPRFMSMDYAKKTKTWSNARNIQLEIKWDNRE